MLGGGENEDVHGNYAHFALSASFVALRVTLCWLVGACILVATEGFSWAQAFYCAAIPSLTIGYGDVYPATQAGRNHFARQAADRHARIRRGWFP